MPPDPNQSASPAHPSVVPRFKFRARFAKAGDLRLVSHHDLMHVFERMFRRADLPLAATQGFNPHPKMAFASSLALGIVGLNEVLEFEMTTAMPIEELERRLTRQCPAGIAINSIRAIDFRASALVRRGFYRVAACGVAVDSTATPQAACNSFLARSECWIERLRPKPRRVNVRPFVDELRVEPEQLHMALWITPNGAARPDEVVQALGLGDWLQAGAVIERTDLEICDELPPGSAGPPRIEAAMEDIHLNDRPGPQEARPTALIGDPLAFDS